LQTVIVNECYDYFLAEKGVKAGDIEKAVADYPDMLLPEFRKKKTCCRGEKTAIYLRI